MDAIETEIASWQQDIVEAQSKLTRARVEVDIQTNTIKEAKKNIARLQKQKAKEDAAKERSLRLLENKLLGISSS